MGRTKNMRFDFQNSTCLAISKMNCEITVSDPPSITITAYLANGKKKEVIADFVKIQQMILDNSIMTVLFEDGSIILTPQKKN